ncbi:multidrug effflux MFS transporter [Dactylosporangium matsuzakiense]|uniref:Bcr/CflA family drug resistance efflux transporter n=1 Tax=Dactylosporangium matsuzakiense TaxID=53360 RepID=A0A9W6KPN9_9ACTN|nr:multidrug effflux MFS transporter [Dactylosporangium matsuzakiense]UWZ40993.1 multidrug effflux MFS transporter [Dactylosporangium matsuzakiense]GLL04800.1 Bcr/CflA family drug resistance efflux transporter [Dactylosporangium matsuzakiense]
MSIIHRVRLALVLGSLSGFGALTIDMYLPAMPGMARDLHASPSVVQLSLIVFVIGLALGQVLIGPLSDTWGRRRPLIVGLSLYVAGSVCCVLAPTGGWLIGARALQSLGAAAGTVLARAIVRDPFQGPAMTRFLSVAMLVTGLAPILAPVVGGQVLRFTSWRGIFIVLAAIGAVLLVTVLVTQRESLPPERRRPAHIPGTLRAMAALATDRSYLRYVLAAALMFAAVFAYISGSSFNLQNVYGLTAQQFSLVFAANGLGIVLLAQVNGFLIGRGREAETLLRSALVIAVVAASGVFACTATSAPLPLLLICLFVVVSMLGPVLPDATTLPMGPHAATAGAASSLQGLLQFLIGAAAASAMGVAGPGSPIAMGVTMLVCAVAALAVLLLLRTTIAEQRGVEAGR